MYNTNLTPMTHFDIATLYNEKIVEKITKKLLINLFSRGNNNAYDIYTTHNNGLITIDDLTQELLLFLCEHSQEWYLERPFSRYSTDEKQPCKLVFFNEETSKQFFKIVSTTLYQNIRKHENKKLWLEIDGEEIKIDDISTLASHTCIDEVMTLSLYNSFCSYLLSTKPKKAQRYIDCINLRLQGYKYNEIAKTLELKETTVKDTFAQLKILWKSFE